MVGALLLRPATYRAAACDQAASLQAGQVVVASGMLEAAVRASVDGESGVASTAVAYATAAALIGWIVWTAIVYAIATRVFAADVDLAGASRAIGLAHAPSLVFGLAALPGVVDWAGVILVGTLAWFVAALGAAVRGLTDATLGRTAAITASALLAHEALHLLGLMD